MAEDYSDEEYMKDFVDELLERTDKDLLGKKYYSSSSFALTHKQIQWLKKFPNKSLLIRLLLEGAMTSRFWDNELVYIEQIQRTEEKIDRCIYEWLNADYESDKKEWMDKLRKLQTQRRRLIGALCQPPLTI